MMNVDSSATLRRFHEFLVALPETNSDDEQFERTVVAWVARLRSSDRAELFLSLPQWLADSYPPYRPLLVPLVGAAFNQPELLARSVEHAMKKPSNSDWRDHEFFQLALIDFANRFHVDALHSYLRTAASQFDGAKTYQAQNIAARAAVSLCYLAEGDDMDCVSQILARLRSRDDSPITEVARLVYLLFCKTGRLSAD